VRLAGGATLANDTPLRNRDPSGGIVMNGADQRIVVVDLRIPFFRLVMFFIKAALAAIPAAIVIGFVLMLITAVIAALAGGSVDFFMRRMTL
jgi:hypothetical protein